MPYATDPELNTQPSIVWFNDESYKVGAAALPCIEVVNIPSVDWDDHDRILSMAVENLDLLQFAPDKLRHNRGFVLSAVQENGLLLKYASAELQSDQVIVLTVMKFYLGYPDVPGTAVCVSRTLV